MRHKTLFRLLLKIVGVILVGIAMPTLVEGAFLCYDWIQDSPGSFRQSFAIYGGYLIGGGIQLLLGLYLLFGGGWLVNRAIPSNRPYCHECGYELSRHGGTECPECGTPLPTRPRGTEPAASGKAPDSCPPSGPMLQ